MAAIRSIADPEINYACLPNELNLLEPGAECHAIGFVPGHVKKLPSLVRSARRSSTTHHVRQINDDEWNLDKLHQLNLTVLRPQECKDVYEDLREQMIICAVSKGKVSK
ncbi:unnamed protein product [Dicrocoelium dendriticum]|nr:unnamed protein product [Dicrocoelium dendriticum]